ncbi:hypothetical protein JW992_15460 [candidate division KSB1 bacterium]|nr:hypothetical protein [candidate division KSB1 bacterium]
MARLWAASIGMLLLLGCAHQSAFRVDEVSEGQSVAVRMTSGDRVEGTVARVETDAVVVTDEAGKNWRARRDAIDSITGPKPVRDSRGRIISEKEIASRRGSKNKWTFAISGGLLSMGSAFFVSSMATRVGDENNRDAIVIGGTAGGTVLGAFLFSRIGARKDRQNAIDVLRAERGSGTRDEILEEREKTESLQQQIEELKKQIQ